MSDLRLHNSAHLDDVSGKGPVGTTAVIAPRRRRDCGRDDRDYGRTRTCGRDDRGYVGRWKWLVILRVEGLSGVEGDDVAVETTAAT